LGNSLLVECRLRLQYDQALATKPTFAQHNYWCWQIGELIDVLVIETERLKRQMAALLWPLAIRFANRLGFH